MFELKTVGPRFLAEVQDYPGLVAVLVYQPSSDVFEEKIRRNYSALHVQSGCNLLVVAGRSNWTSKSAQSRMKQDVLRRVQPGQYMMKHMVKLSDDDEFQHAQNLMDLQGRFGLRNSELPCLLFLADPRGTKGYVFKFDRAAVTQTSDALMEQLSDVFEVCGTAVAGDPFHLTGAEATAGQQLIDWREKIMLTVEPRLKRLQIFSTVRKLGPAIAGEMLKGLSGI